VTPPQRSAELARRELLSGLLFGCGIAAALIDLLVFHLGLQWHHFYDLSTPRVAITADGFFHAFAWFITVAGLFLLAEVRRLGDLRWSRWAAAVVTGVGFFQLLDGVINHKILGIHEIRYGVDLLPYDVAWIGGAIVLLVLGLGALRFTRTR
jgi:uncharacterized membrane protein